MRCGPPLLGNLLAGTFKPRTGSAVCDTQFCYYFCQKYTETARASASAGRPVHITLAKAVKHPLPGTWRAR
jgi:hypothetical protein